MLTERASYEYVRRSLLPTLMPFDGINPKSVVIMDNASIHHVEEVVSTIEGIGSIVKFLPPYSPDLNPIEEVFFRSEAVDQIERYCFSELTKPTCLTSYSI